MSQLFSYESHQVRTLSENGETWFAAVDVCRCLVLTWSGATLKAIPKCWQRMLKFNTPSGVQGFKAISEPAVYKLAFRSNKPEADAFTNWVASEVLPSIRKTGKYEPSSALDSEEERKRRLARERLRRYRERKRTEKLALPTPKKRATLSEYAAKINTLSADAEQKANECIKAVSDLGFALLFRPACLDPEVSTFGKALEHNLPALSFAAQTSVKALCDMVGAYMDGLTVAQE